VVGAAVSLHEAIRIDDGGTQLFENPRDGSLACADATDETDYRLVSFRLGSRQVFPAEPRSGFRAWHQA